MIFLFLDTSSDNLVVSLLKNKKLLSTKMIKSLNDHSSYIVKTVREILNENNIKINDISKIFCTIGPGSFTGTRIGITVAKTIAWSLKINVVAVSSLKQYIFEYSNYDYYVPVIEDKKGLYFSVYDKNYNEILSEKYIDKELLNDYLKEYKGKIKIINEDKKINVEKLVEYYDSDGINPHKLKPNYIKKIDAESKL